jgi:hypothetical protein
VAGILDSKANVLLSIEVSRRVEGGSLACLGQSLIKYVKVEQKNELEERSRRSDEETLQGSKVVIFDSSPLRESYKSNISGFDHSGNPPRLHVSGLFVR